MEYQIYYDPLDSACKSVVGAVCEGKELCFTLFTLRYGTKCEFDFSNCIRPNENATLIFNKDGEPCEYFPMQITDYGWQIRLKIHRTGLYYYHFRIDGKGDVFDNGTQKGTVSHSQIAFLLTVYSKTYRTPEWFKGGIMYQIFPDRFAKEGSMPDITGRVLRSDWGGTPLYKPNENGKVLNNDFFGGNFKGIQSKLPYLKSLGVTVLYLNPIFEAASNHRYDTSDYLKIDPFLGTKKDFEELLEAAESYGIRLILDGVFNHTGDNSVYFNKYGKYPSLGAYQSKDSPYYSWYSFEEFPDRYDSWWGIDILPQVNENSEEYQRFIFGENGVLKTWLRYGIGGYRLDVADELPDFFLKKLRESVKTENEEAMIIGEVWEDASDKIAYSKRREYLQGYELDSVMNYPLKDGIIAYIKTENEQFLLNSIRKLIDHYPKQSLDCLMNILGTHDTARILTVLGGKICQNKDEMASEKGLLTFQERPTALNKLKMAALLQYTLPGVPCVYYGDEHGMEGHIDPFCRKCFEWDRLNEDLISYYQTLGQIRTEERELFKDGEFIEISAVDGLLIYERRKNKKSVYIYVNNSSKKHLLNLKGNYIEKLTNTKKSSRIEISPYSFGILVKS